MYKIIMLDIIIANHYYIFSHSIKDPHLFIIMYNSRLKVQ